MPNVMAAAIRPKSTCLKPEDHRFLPVNKVIALPIRKSPIALKMTLSIIDFMPVVNRNGANGIIAPMENNIKE
jgi:hypothetical protein